MPAPLPFRWRVLSGLTLTGVAIAVFVPTTAAAQQCHPSYRGVCIPPRGGDVDCAGGSGNGPRYVRGPVQVVGPDPYRLDRDGDGIACERS